MLDTHPTSQAQPQAIYIGGYQYRRKAYGSNHPLSIPRVSLATELIHAYGALNSNEYISARKAADFELEWFHTPEYVSAFKRAEALGRVTQEVRLKHGLGTLENPYFDQFFTIPATATGASIQAAEVLLSGRIAFNPAGGMHHAQVNQAQGFCYFNDVVLAILRLRHEHLRVLYVDIDAHHGDGVETAFLGDSNVFTLSLHMDTAYAYPFKGGQVSDCAKPNHTSLNIPLPHGTHDAEYQFLFDSVWTSILSRFQPDAIVVQAGTDSIFADPLGKLRLTTQGFLSIVQRILETAPCHPHGTPSLLITGGGGYHPLVLARAWAGLWGLISGRQLPESLPEAGRSALHAVKWDLDEDEDYFSYLFHSRLDHPQEAPIRQEIYHLANLIQQHPFFSEHL